MADIAPEIYAKIKESFDRKYAQAQLFGGPLSDIVAKINNGTATFQDANIYATMVGGYMADAMKENLILDELPGKRLYNNIAKRTIGEGLKDTYGIVSAASKVAQEEHNAAAKIGLKPVQPKLETDRVDKIVNKAVKAETQEALNEVIDKNVSTFARQVVDDTQKANARLHNKVGLKVTVEREYDGVGLHDGEDVCDWCLQRAGTWTYEKAMTVGAFERHEGCGCEIIYTSRKGITSRQVNWQGNEWKEGKREDLVEEAKNDMANRKKTAEEQRRNRLLNLGSTRDFQRQYATYSTKKLEHFTLNNLYIADDVNLKPREIRRIDKQITQSKELLSLTSECKAPIVIVNDDDRLAAYDPHTDTFFVSSLMADSSKITELQNTFVCSEDERSTMVHELFHWKDAEDYRNSGKIINDASEKSTYSVYQREKAYDELNAAGVDLKNLDYVRREISVYAEKKCIANDYEEVYTEYRTLKAIEGSK